MKNVIYLVVIIVVSFLAYSLTLKDNNETNTKPEPFAKTPAATQEKSELANDNPFSSLLSEAADGAEVFIIEPVDGATVSSPITVKFGIRNMTVAKAGDQTEFSGHHHLLINLDQLPNLQAPLPATDQIIHFGGAQTETTINLTPGEHSLQLLLGNYVHIPHKQAVLSKKITIDVQ